MDHSKLRLLSSILLLGLCARCNNPVNTITTMNVPDSSLIDRPPAVAGQFYPSDSAELRKEVLGYFSKCSRSPGAKPAIAIITPHAGYVYSGEVAAAAFSRIDPEKPYKTVFIIGCSHRAGFRGGSVYTLGNYVTPLGKVPVDLELAKTLAAANRNLSADPLYHKGEHSIEVQVPFLQVWLKKPFKIVPILLGSQDPEVCKSIAATLKPYLTPDNLFVISTDFSHYPEYRDAVIVDKTLADAILTNDPERFIKEEQSCEEKPVKNLATGCCSWPAVATLMYMTAKDPDYRYEHVLYKNSGDSRYGEKDRVVGYNAIAVSFTGEAPGFSLDREEQKTLLQIARKTIGEYLGKGTTYKPDLQQLPSVLTQKAGAFVTLKKNGELRGCIGHFDADHPLYDIVQQMAIAAATEDYRFPQVTESELKTIAIEISVLTPMRKIASVNEIRLGRDGIYIRKGNRAGTFLPQVATETGWSLEEFLGHCARDKAGIGWDGWKDSSAEIFTYQAYVFDE